MWFISYFNHLRTRIRVQDNLSEIISNTPVLIVFLQSREQDQLLLIIYCAGQTSYSHNMYIRGLEL